MYSDPPRAALYYLGSVFFFALASNLTVRLVPGFSSILIMGLRCLFGGGILWLWALSFERPFNWSFLPTAPFWLWFGAFVWTLFFYALAFTSTALEGVFLIVSTMPLFVIGIDYSLDRSSLDARLITPILVMFFTALAASIYSFVMSGTETKAWVLIAAMTATFSHAVWVVVGRTVQLRAKFSLPATRASVMFLIGGVILGVASALTTRIEQDLRSPFFKTNFYEYATASEWLTLGLAGIFSAVTVLFVTHALRRDRAANVIPYHYTFGVWGLVFAIPNRSDWSIQVLFVPMTAAAIIAGCSVWLYLRRTA